MDNRSTDPAPLTASALLPPNFTAGTTYALVSSTVQACTAPPMMTANISAVLSSNGCTRELAGSYIGPDADGSGDILVAVQIYPFTDLNTASRVHQALVAFFKDDAGWNYGFYCPPSGPGWLVCANGSGVGFSASVFLQHRYVVVAQATYVNLEKGHDSWTLAAAIEGTHASGPNFYAITR